MKNYSLYKANNCCERYHTNMANGTINVDAIAGSITTYEQESGTLKDKNLFLLYNINNKRDIFALCVAQYGIYSKIGTDNAKMSYYSNLLYGNEEYTCNTIIKFKKELHFLLYSCFDQYKKTNYYINSNRNTSFLQFIETEFCYIMFINKVRSVNFNWLIYIDENVVNYYNTLFYKFVQAPIYSQLDICPSCKTRSNIHANGCKFIMETLMHKCCPQCPNGRICPRPTEILCYKDNMRPSGTMNALTIINIHGGCFPCQSCEGFWCIEGANICSECLRWRKLESQRYKQNNQISLNTKRTSMASNIAEGTNAPKKSKRPTKPKHPKDK